MTGIGAPSFFPAFLSRSTPPRESIILLATFYLVPQAL